MRVNDLSKELGKPNRELIEFLRDRGVEHKAPMSNVSEKEAEMIRNYFKPKKTEAAGVKKTETAETIGNHQAEGQGTEAAPKKKKFTAVFRPQNAQQIKVKPAKPQAKAMKPSEQQPLSREAAGNPASGAVAPAPELPKQAEGAAQLPEKKREEAAAAEETRGTIQKPEETNQAPEASKPSAPPQEKKDAVRPAVAVRPERSISQTRPRGGYSGNRRVLERLQQQDRDQASRRGRTGAQGDRPHGAYQGRGSQGGYQSRGAQGGNYQNRSAQGGYQSRGAQGGNYQNRSPQGGYQGRGAQSGNYQNRSPQGGGYQSRGSQDGGFSRRRGNFAGGDAMSGDAPLVKKPVSNRPNKSNFKDKSDRRYKTEDGFRNGGKNGKVSRHPFIMPEKPKAEKVEEEIREIVIPETITISDLAKRMKKNASDLIKKLFAKGELYTINAEIPYEKAEEIALDYDILCTQEVKVDVIEELLREEEDKAEDLVPRPPVVCVMGHVDHGKTSLLDAIRKTNVTSREAGGITQHIGAYVVKVQGRTITFLDTPGHEAFTAMRMRGAQATDIAVLVVAADDGIMPQTVEAINHAKAAGVDLIVAINKIDKPDANVERVKQELMQYELVSEDWGGSTICCPISAKSGEGIETLLEMILLTADVKELKANPNRNARGLVVEAQLDRGKGPIATVLVQKGTLHVGDYVAAGSCYGKIRAMLNDRGARVKEAKPSTPVEIQGLNAVPDAGEIFVAMDSDKEAKDFAATFVSENKNKLIEETKAKLSLDDVFGQIKAGEIKELPIIVKADVQGSVEAVKQSLGKLSNDEVQVKVIHDAVGAISESDVALASASNAIIIGFNVRPDTTAKSIAAHEKVDIRLYKVIYQAIEDIEAALTGMLAPVYEEQVIGHAEVRALFKASGVGTIAGSYVLDGKIQRGCKARITRGGDQIFDGELASLKRFKDDVKEVNAGYECGLVFEKFNDLMEGDQVEAYAMVAVPRK